ncbi:MAG: transporter substrate-binding domain-containing protein [Halioglobus sp.]|nr:transporter substrate-binding domain-containing protein [Halioglobus sp.]
MLKWILASLVVAMFCGTAQAGQEFTLMANTSPPYADAKLPEQGLALELVKTVFAKTAFTPKITIENWSRALEGTEVDVYDALASVWYSKERDKDLLFSKPYLRSELLILKLRSNRGTYTSLDQLAGSRLGIRTDYAYGIDFDAIPDLTLVQQDQLVPNLLNLLDGKVDFVIADQRTAAMQLHEFFSDKITQFAVVEIALPPVERHVAASRAWPDAETMIAEFNRALDAAQKDGSLQAIIDKWDERYGGVE